MQNLNAEDVPTGHTPTGHTPQAGAIAPRLLRFAAVAGILVAGGTVTSACSSSSKQPSALSADCTNVGNILSDGPDPDADPVGYAEAQVSPLRQLTISEANLRSAVSNLATAYEQVFKTNGTKAATQEETTASNKVNAICPGVAP